MLQKTMVVVEGVARKLDPQLNMWSTAEPVVGAWIAENLGPVGRLEDAGRSLSSIAAFLADAPRRLEQIAAKLETDSENEIAKNRSRAHSPAGLYLCSDWIFAGAPVCGGVPVDPVIVRAMQRGGSLAKAKRNQGDRV